MLNIKGTVWDKEMDEHEHQILQATAKKKV